MGKKKGSGIFSLKTFLFLVLIGGASAVVTTIMNSNKIAKKQEQTQPHKKNPNVFKLAPVDKETFNKASIPTRDEMYIEKKVISYVRKNAKPVSRCFYKYKGDKKLRTGVIGLHWAITKEGKPTKIKVYKDEVKNSDVTACVLKQAKTWKFAKHSFEKPQTISFPFFFSIGRKPPKTR